jgi:two-component system LytT family response regulator
MVTAIVIEHVKASLLDVEQYLTNYQEISILGIYSNPSDAILDIERRKPQVVFAGIPPCGGMDAASEIKKASPNTELVILSPVEQYAVKAFDLQALDYLVMPVDRLRFDQTIQRLYAIQNASRQYATKDFQIRCFGKLYVRWWDGGKIKWRSEKTKELFAFLLQNQGIALSKEEMIDHLRPNEDPDKAMRQLYNDVYHIRKTLQQYGIQRSVLIIEKNYNLVLGDVNYDVGQFKELCKNGVPDDITELEKLAELYTGDYLEGEDYFWAGPERMELENQYIQVLIKLSKHYLVKGKIAQAEQILGKAFEKNPYEEAITELMLQMFFMSGEKSKCVKHFKTFSDLLKKDLGIEPNQNLSNLYRSVIKN